MARSEFGQFKSEDYTGQRYGKFVVLYKTDMRGKNGEYIWKCLCDCGKEFYSLSWRIKRRKSCGCAMYGNSGAKKPKDFGGQIKRGFIAVKDNGTIGNNGYHEWIFRCIYCGKELIRQNYYFTREAMTCDCDEWVKNHGKKIGTKALENHQSYVNIQYAHYKRSAIDRSYQFELTKEQFRSLIESDCYYCGAKPKMRNAKNLHGEYSWNGIDRFDNDKGYVIDNCVPCCTTCNFAKGKSNGDDFIRWIKTAYLHISEKGVI